MINGNELKIPAIVISGSLYAAENLSLKSNFPSPSIFFSLKQQKKTDRTTKILIPKLIKLENLNAFSSLGKEIGKRSPYENKRAQQTYPVGVFPIQFGNCDPSAQSGFKPFITLGVLSLPISSSIVYGIKFLNYKMKK